MEKILVIDIGNTSTAYGLYRAGKISRLGRLPTREATHAKIRSALKDHRTHSAVIASVVPSLNGVWAKALGRPILWAGHELKLSVTIDYAKPASIGADRLANACGGLVKYGCPLIVADFGTAVTFDCVTRKGAYVGGVIAPGLPLMFSYLAEKTAKLPLIKVGPTRSKVGRSTTEAMKLGARWGYRGMVREIVSELLKHPDLRGAKLVATGGYASWVVRGLNPRMIVDPTLTLYGLGQMHEMNVKS